MGWQWKNNTFLMPSLFLVMLLLEKSGSSDVCTTPACRKASSDVLSFIDPSVDPCQDFYKFVCGGIFKKTHESKPVSIEAMVKKEVDQQTTLMLIKPIDHTEPKAIQGLKKFFRSCMDEATIEKYSLSSLKRALQLLGGWPIVDGETWSETEFSVEELLVKLRKMGFNFNQLVYLRTSVGEEEKYVVDQPQIEIIEDKDGYQGYMREIVILLGADEEIAQNELTEMLVFRSKLIKIMVDEEDLTLTTIANLQIQFPLLANWSRFVNSIIFPNEEVPEDEEIYINKPRYFKDLENLIWSTSNRTLANYIIWEAINSLITYLPKEFRDIKEQYMDLAENQTEDESRLTFCKHRAQETLRPTFEALYLKDYFSNEKMEVMQEITSLIKEELFLFITHNALYDEETKEEMLEKAYNVTFLIGGPERMFDEEFLVQLFDENQIIKTNDFLTIASSLARQSANLALNLEDKIEFSNNFFDEIVFFKPFYHAASNTMVLPAGSLQNLYFNENQPQYLNFGAIGRVLSKELFHGIAPHRNYNGYAQLLRNGPTEKFFENAECLIKQAEDFKIENSNLQMDGNRVIDENICDFTSVELAYRAYESWIEENDEENKLPGLQYTPKQLFWISTASSFCDTVTLDNLQEFIENANISHPTFRIFGALTNNEHFGEDFGCPIGTPMNPPNKCRLF